MSAHEWSNRDLVCLAKAVLCANCEVISESINGHCAACGSQALLRLSQLLGGSIEADSTFSPALQVEILSASAAA